MLVLSGSGEEKYWVKHHDMYGKIKKPGGGMRTYRIVCKGRKQQRNSGKERNTTKTGKSIEKRIRKQKEQWPKLKWKHVTNVRRAGIMRGPG